MIEQAGVQAELTKLERLARAHRAEQRRLTDVIRSTGAEATRRRAEATIYNQAIARRVDTSGDRFAMDVDGTRHTKRVDAGTALLSQARDTLHEILRHRGDHETRPRTIGQLAGFPVQIEGYKVGQSTEARLKVVLHDQITFAVRLRPDELATKQPDKLVGQLEGTLRKLEDRRDSALTDANDMDQYVTEAEAQTGALFADQERLDRFRARHQEIIDELNTEAETAQAPDSEPPAPEDQAVAVEVTEIEPLGLD